MSDKKLWDQFVRLENERDHLRADLAEAREVIRNKEAMIWRMRWLLQQIIGSLPASRDWLDPAAEREAREAIK